ncbi:hypothetical protein OF83DRAFT_1057064 [Amylostereum chailletii]|nr:hypothetical protein OF83DRAFT_1057064 [Amylostereum chailletii]
MRLPLARPCIRARIDSLYTHTRRFASINTNPYPFPAHAQPTPHQLFHLPLSATQKEIKARYFDLVKLYHPDAPLSRTSPPDVAQARFHAISNAYDVLRGHRPNALVEGSSSDGAGSAARDFRSEIWRAKQARRADLNVPFDDRWKDRVILGAVVVVRVLPSVSFHLRYVLADEHGSGSRLVRRPNDLAAAAEPGRGTGVYAGKSARTGASEERELWI